MRAVVRVAFLAALAGCYSNQGSGEEESPYPEVEAVSIPETVQTQRTTVVMRLTNGGTLDTHIYDSLNRLANEKLDLADLLMRGGLPKTEDGTEITPAVADVGGTSPEQLAFWAASGIVTADEAVDACGNRMLGTFVTPRMLQHAGLGADHATFPGVCGGADCDTLQWGTIELVTSGVRFDGMMDMVVNVYPNLSTGTPALWGHLLGFFLTGNNPGFTEIPVVVNADKAQVLLLNLWQEQKSYVHEGVGERQVLAIPHTERSVNPEADIIVTLGPPSQEECERQWEAIGGQGSPLGCEEGLPLLLDQTAAAGDELYDTYFKAGADPSAMETVQRILAYQIQSAVACPGAGLDRQAWVQDGGVELVVCPDGDVDTCLAAEDMEEYACRPVEETLDERYPETGTPLVLSEQRDPLVLHSYSHYLDLLAEDPYGDLFTDPPTSFGTGEVEIEVTVDADTVIYLSQPERVSVVGVSLPAPVANTHCPEEPAFRYDVGESWPAGTYTLTVPWTDFDEDLVLHVTSVPTWVF